jgi:hypothetical protein
MNRLAAEIVSKLLVKCLWEELPAVTQAQENPSVIR